MSFLANIFGYLLKFLYNIFQNYGVAILVFSVLVRVLLIPITIKQQTTMKKNSKIQNEMKSIQVKYKNDPDKMNKEVMDLYKRENMSPFSGCFSAIIQIVLILAVFYLVRSPLSFMMKIDSNVINDYTNKLVAEGMQQNNAYKEIAIIEKYGIQENYNEQTGETEKVKTNVFVNMDFLGINLSTVPTQKLDDYRTYIIPILYVISSYISVKLTSATQGKQKSKQEVIEIKQDDSEVVNNNPDTQESMERMSKNMTFMMPLMSIPIAFIAPLGLALYWLASNILMIIERLIINKYLNNEEE